MRVKWVYFKPLSNQADDFKQDLRRNLMAKSQNRILIKMKSTESTHVYHTKKNRQNNPDRMELKKFDPLLRKHVLYREDR